MPRLVRLHALLDEAVRGLLRRRVRHLERVHEDLLERVLRARGRRAHEQVDAAADRRAGHVAPVARLRRRRSTAPAPATGSGTLLALVGDEADAVAGDLVEDESARVAGLRVARRVADRDAAARDVGDADVRAALKQLELDAVVALRHVGAGELRGEWGDRGRPAHRDRRLPGRGRRHRDGDGDGERSGKRCCPEGMLQSEFLSTAGLAWRVSGRPQQPM